MGITETLKTTAEVASGVASIASVVVAYIDPTFFGLVNMNAFIASSAFKLALIAAIVAVLILMALYWKTLSQDPPLRNIPLAWSFLLLLLCMILFFAINQTTAHLDFNPPIRTDKIAFWESILKLQYAAILFFFVLATGRIAFRVIPKI
jgi:hypothetical protein